MSDTPRTDAEGCYPDDACSDVVDADFARTLERELTAAKAGRTQGGPAMSDLYKAAQQALEVLESYRGQVNIHGESPAADMCAIVRAALAQQAEPVREWQGLTKDDFPAIRDGDTAFRSGALWADRLLKEKNT
jgi:hypothetical protein